MALLFALTSLTIWPMTGYAQTRPVAPVEDKRVFVPFVSKIGVGNQQPSIPNDSSAEGNAAEKPVEPPDCEFRPFEQELADLLENDSGQQRSSLVCSPILTRVARERAQDMASRAYLDHVNPDGYGPNFLILQAGYQLPAFYSRMPTANEIESIAAGSQIPSDTWLLWMQSDRHRDHLLGNPEEFRAQTVFGIGYAYLPGSPYEHYWVIIIAPAEP